VSLGGAFTPGMRLLLAELWTRGWPIGDVESLCPTDEEPAPRFDIDPGSSPPAKNTFRHEGQRMLAPFSGSEAESTFPVVPQ
jgi:hypothetical protein